MCTVFSPCHWETKERGSLVHKEENWEGTAAIQGHDRTPEAGSGIAKPAALPPQSGTGSTSSGKHLNGSSASRGITQHGRQKRYRLRAALLLRYFCIVVAKITRGRIGYFDSWLEGLPRVPYPHVVGQSLVAVGACGGGCPHFRVDRSKTRRVLVFLSLSPFSPFILSKFPAHEKIAIHVHAGSSLLSVLSRNMDTDISEEASLMP